MKTIDEQLAELSQEISNIIIEPDALDVWRNNPITKRLMLECQFQVLTAFNLRARSERRF